MNTKSHSGSDTTRAMYAAVNLMIVTETTQRTWVFSSAYCVAITPAEMIQPVTDSKV